MRHRIFKSGLEGLALVALVAAGLYACGSSTQLVDVWKDSEAPRQPLHDVLVVQMSRDPAHRRMWEDEFAYELKHRGVEATPSYRIWANALPDTNEIVSAVQRSGYDGVIMSARLPGKTQTYYVPGYATSVPVTRYSPWYDAYFTYYQGIYQPGYVETEHVARARTDVWSTDGNGRLIWTGTSEVYDPSSNNAVKQEVAKKIVPELAKQRVIAS
jgi:hypothetical protein